MSIEEFIEVQRKLIINGGFCEFLPTVWIETSNQVHVSVLTEATKGGELESAACEWAQRLARNRNYFLAFLTNDSHLKCIANVNGINSEKVVNILAK